MLDKQLTLPQYVVQDFSSDNSLSVGVPETFSLTSHAINLHVIPVQSHILMARRITNMCDAHVFLTKILVSYVRRLRDFSLWFSYGFSIEVILSLMSSL